MFEIIIQFDPFLSRHQYCEDFQNILGLLCKSSFHMLGKLSNGMFWAVRQWLALAPYGKNIHPRVDWAPFCVLTLAQFVLPVPV